MSRRIEYKADATAAEVTGRPDYLAKALAKIRDWNGANRSQSDGGIYSSLWISSLKCGFMSSILSFHPPTDERIRRLLAMSFRII